MSGERTIPATAFADADWTAARLRELAVRYGTADPAVLAALWWYSASAVLVAPALAGLVAGRPLSARLADVSVAMLPGPVPMAATSSAPAEDLSAELRETLSAVVTVIAAAADVRPRPLWAIATDSIASRLLALGSALGDVPRTTALAVSLADQIGPPLLTPAYVDVGGTRFVHRVSCCQLYRAPGQPMCTSCPRRPETERRTLLAELR